jgi:hypothetical protein
METYAETEARIAAERDANTRLHRRDQVISSATLKVSVKTDRRDEVRRMLADPEDVYLPAMRAEKADTLAAIEAIDLEAAQSPAPPDTYSADYVATERERQRQLKRRRSVALTRLDAILHGGFRDTDLEERLLARGVRPLDGYHSIFKGPFRVSLPRCESAVAAMQEELSRVEAELAAAQKELDAVTS